MAQSQPTMSRRASVFTLLVSAAALILAGLGLSPAQATHQVVTEVEGSAFNCSSNTNFFGQPQPPVEPTASVTLPPGGSATPITETAPCTVRIVFPGGAPGPIILSTGPVTVSTQGTTGPTGSVTSTATATDVGQDANEALQAASISATCTADESGVTGSTTVTGGTVVTDQNAGTTEAVPENPDPGYTIEGVNGAGDRYRYVFNEQTINPDGSITVNAVHLYLLGPNATGDVILGQVVCGVTTQEAPTTTTTEATTTTTTEATTTTTTEATTTTTTEATTTTTTEATTTTTEATTTTTTEAPTTTTTEATTTTTEATTTTTTEAPTTTTTEAPTTTTTEAPGNMPTRKDQCKNGGFENFGFRNQGQCVSFVASDGRSGGPSPKAQCKKGGWANFGYRNQGQCVSFYASDGRSGGPAQS